MRQIVNRFVGVITMVAGCAAGCASAHDAPLPSNLPTKEAQQKLVEGLTAVQPKMRLRRKLGAPKPAEQARLPLAQNEDRSQAPEGQAWDRERKAIEENLAGGAKDDWSDVPAEDKERVLFADGDSEWELEFDRKELSALRESATSRGINNATEGGDAGDASPPDMETLGWSNGIDSRVMKPINGTYPINHRVLMRIGELNGGGCSGALIGRRLVLTAAHCVVPADGSILTHTFRARRSGAQAPFGAVSTSAYWWSYHWTANNCHSNRRFDPCSQHDWAILRLPDNAWDNSPNGTPGWMGYWIYGQAKIQNEAVSNNDGYPACGLQGSPSGCATNPNQIWGQNFAGTARGFLWPHDNVPAFYRASMDITGGHSGSPNWTDYPGANGPYAIGIAMWEHCFGSSCSNLSGDYVTHPNGYRGMTPFLADFITTQRTSYP